jgi:trk system potassium uptake protein TrkH
MALVSIAVCAVFREWYGTAGFLATIVITVLPGQGILWWTRHAPAMQRHHAMQVAALAWLAIPTAGTLPYFLSARLVPGGAGSEGTGALLHFRHALFESISGFTSTGLSVIAHPSALPHHLQWWRSLTEWVGGIGVIVLLLTVLPANRSSLYLYFSEAREEKILPTVKSTVRTIWALYLGYSVLAVLLLWAVGEPFWRALNHAMAALSTGGFSITDDSLKSAPAAVQLAYVPIMLLGAISYVTHYRVVREGRWRAALWGSAEIRLFWIIVVAGFIVVAVDRLTFSGNAAWVRTLVQWISAVSTTGFSTEAVSTWMPAPLLLLVFAMVVGAMSGSSGGGLKQARVAILLRDLGWFLRSFRASAHEVKRATVDGERLSPEELGFLARSAATLAGAYLLLWITAVLVMLHVLPTTVPVQHVFFEAASAQSTVGLSTGITGAGMHPVAEAVLMILMITGRLEIFPLLLLVAWVFQRR